MNEEEVRKIIREELAGFLGLNKYIFDKGIQVLDGRNIQLGRNNGTFIGTAEDQKLGFYGATPVAKGNAISDPVGGLTQDNESRTAIALIIDALQDIGIIK